MLLKVYSIFDYNDIRYINELVELTIYFTVSLSRSCAAAFIFANTALVCDNVSNEVNFHKNTIYFVLLVVKWLHHYLNAGMKDI